MMGGTSLKWKVTPKTNLDLYATVFNTDEREYFDILGQYYINELEMDKNTHERQLESLKKEILALKIMKS